MVVLCGRGRHGRPSVPDIPSVLFLWGMSGIIEYGISGEGSQILTNQKLENSAF